MTKAEYREYLASDHWKSFRRAYYARYKRECVICYATEKLNIHHRFYRKRGESILNREEFSDVCFLCHSCHSGLHRTKSERLLCGKRYWRQEKLEKVRAALGVTVEHREIDHEPEKIRRTLSQKEKYILRSARRLRRKIAKQNKPQPAKILPGHSKRVKAKELQRRKAIAEAVLMYCKKCDRELCFPKGTHECLFCKAPVSKVRQP